MKIVALHTDFRIYWPARLKAFDKYLLEQNSSLEVIEIAGKGSPYSFASKESESELKWHILFPDSKPEELSGKTIKPKLFKLLDSINPDVVLAGAIAFPSGALAVQWANSRPNKRVVIFDDAKNDAVNRSKIVNFIKKNIYSGIDAMLYPAEPWIPTGKSWGFKNKQIFFGVDVVDNDFWSTPTHERPFDFKYFVAVGRQIPLKNFVSIIKAYHLYIQQIGTDVAYKLVVIGDGPEHKIIQDYINQNNLDNYIICQNFLPQTQLRPIYQNASLLCLNSIQETWGLVINEAMSCGCAIIASRECGATDVLVKDGLNGYKTDSLDIEGLSSAMMKYHSLSDRGKGQMSDASKKIISEWNLDRFCRGAYEACKNAYTLPRQKRSLLSKLIISKWNGQYRPI